VIFVCKRSKSVEEKLSSFVSSSRVLMRATGPLFRVKPESMRHKGGRGTEVLSLAKAVLGLLSDWDYCQGWDPWDQAAPGLRGAPELWRWEDLSEWGWSPRNLAVCPRSGVGSPAGTLAGGSCLPLLCERPERRTGGHRVPPTPARHLEQGVRALEEQQPTLRGALGQAGAAGQVFAASSLLESVLVQEGLGWEFCLCV